MRPRSLVPALFLIAAGVMIGGCAAFDHAIEEPVRSAERLLPKHYLCMRAPAAPVIDGRLDDPAWACSPWSDPFVDIQGDVRPRPRFRTRVKMTWDDEALYIAAEMEEPHIWGTLTEHDQIVFYDNDFEIFIDPDGDRREYYEIEVNVLNTIFDLFLPKTYNSGGRARHDWSLAGMQNAVALNGTLNDPSDVDEGWTVEFALPWSSLREYANKPSPPSEGQSWRINFSRVEWQHEVVDGKYRKIEGTDEDNWVWSPQGVINMHVPEHWGYVVFAGAK